MRASIWTSSERRSPAVACESAGARRVDLDAGYLVMGPELPDISSSAAREALARGDRARAAALLHPAVLEWCEKHGPWRASTAPARDGLCKGHL